MNVKQSDNEEEKKPPRLIMRADGVLRVMLNTPIFKGMTVGDPQGNEPKSKQIHLASLETGRSVPILLRVSLPSLAYDDRADRPFRCLVKTLQRSYIMSSVASWRKCDHKLALYCLGVREIYARPILDLRFGCDTNVISSPMYGVVGCLVGYMSSVLAVGYMHWPLLVYRLLFLQ